MFFLCNVMETIKIREHIIVLKEFAIQLYILVVLTFIFDLNDLLESYTIVFLTPQFQNRFSVSSYRTNRSKNTTTSLLTSRYLLNAWPKSRGIKTTMN